MRAFWWLIAVVLMFAAGLQGLRLRDGNSGDTSSPGKHAGLAHRLPRAIAGWTSTDEPLGPTEFLQTAVEKTLNYDDMVNRVYRKGDRRVGLYVAYWSPGRMPVQKVASHTPDRCWSENGWSCEALRIERDLKAGDQRLLPARWRLFRPPANSGAKQYVLYWHLVGGELYDYGEGFNQRLSPVQWWRETLHYAVKGSSNQYFVRLMSAQPLDELHADAGFQEILRALAKLGLAVP